MDHPIQAGALEPRQRALWVLRNGVGGKTPDDRTGLVAPLPAQLGAWWDQPAGFGRGRVQALAQHR